VSGVGFAFVAYQGAGAAMHDRPERAYPITTSEFAAYQWVRAQTPADAVVAAHPAHKVNELGERIQYTTLLSGVTGRAIYLQRITPFMQPEAERRVTLLQALFSVPSEDDACRQVQSAHFDYLLEYDAEVLSSRHLSFGACLCRKP
jgi:hypothetical protein